MLSLGPMQNLQILPVGFLETYCAVCNLSFRVRAAVIVTLNSQHDTFINVTHAWPKQATTSCSQLQDEKLFCLNQ